MVLLGDDRQLVPQAVVHLSPDTGGDLVAFESDEDVPVERVKPRKYRLVVPRKPYAGTVEWNRLFGPSKHAGVEAPIWSTERRNELRADLVEALTESSDVVDGILGDREYGPVRRGDAGDRAYLAVPPR
jgi:hypothetical protein